MRSNKKAQSTLEYIIVLAAVIAAIIIFATSTFSKRYTNSLDRLSGQMENVVNRLQYP